MFMVKGASVHDIRKIFGIFYPPLPPPCHCHRSADFVPSVCFLGTPTHCGRHIWKPQHKFFLILKQGPTESLTASSSGLDNKTAVRPFGILHLQAIKSPIVIGDRRHKGEKAKTL